MKKISAQPFQCILTEQNQGKRMNKLLIIDDEASILTALTFALEDTYEVSTFADPEAALTLLETETFHLCLLDLKIGTIDGIEILKRIKKTKRHTLKDLNQHSRILQKNLLLFILQ